MAIVAKGNKPFTALYWLVSFIFLLTNKLEVFISVNILNYSTLGRSSPEKKVTTELMRQLLIRFFFLLRIRHWCPCLSRFNYSWIDFLNIQLWFHLKSSTPSWLRKFFSSFVDRNFAKKKRKHTFWIKSLLTLKD